jgi:hypothetical protein
MMPQCRSPLLGTSPTHPCGLRTAGFVYAACAASMALMASPGEELLAWYRVPVTWDVTGKVIFVMMSRPGDSVECTVDCERLLFSRTLAVALCATITRPESAVIADIIKEGMMITNFCEDEGRCSIEEFEVSSQCSPP